MFFVLLYGDCVGVGVGVLLTVNSFFFCSRKSPRALGGRVLFFWLYFCWCCRSCMVDGFFKSPKALVKEKGKGKVSRSRRCFRCRCCRCRPCCFFFKSQRRWWRRMERGR